MVWGIIAGCLAAPNNFGGFTAVRTMLGFAEGAVQPAFVIITSTWYKKSEHSFRVAYVSFALKTSLHAVLTKLAAG